MAEHGRRLAAIDVGTNSIHLVIVNVNPATGRFRILDREKEMVRLGKGTADMQSLSRSAMDRGIETLRRYKRIADAAGAPVRAVATSAVREARNQRAFIRRARSETGIDVEIISGVEEARLIYLGVLQALPVFNKQILLVDIGGGSSEFLVARKRTIQYDNSLKLGSIRLTERFFRRGEVTKGSLTECREFIKGSLNPVSRAVERFDAGMAVGSSGTIQSIAMMIQRSKEGQVPCSMNAFVFTRKELRKITERVTGARSMAQRMKIPGLDPRRADIIVAGVLIMEQVFEELEIEQMVVSEFALREGIIYDTIEKQYRRQSYHSLRNIRYGSVLQLAQNLLYERHHSHHVAKLALRIFDQTRRIHGLGDAEREYLDAAAILHEIGLSLSHDNHHLHSYYLIRNAELLGYNENEKEIIANIARYHRKGHPKPKHDNYGRLSPADQMTVKKLASMLRIADGLDRTHSAAVADLRCRISGKSMNIGLKPSKTHPVDLEMWGANRKKELFEETFGRRVSISLPRRS